MHTLTNNILKNNIALICIIFLLGFAAHACMLSGTFKTLDDSYSIINNPDIKEFSNTVKIFRSSFFGGKHYYRPLVSLSFMAEYHLFGLRPFYYNLTNLILHLSIAATVFFLISRICNDRIIAFFTSLLFAVHPIQWEAVSNIPGRAVILSTFFTVNTLFFYCLARDKQRFVFYYGLSLFFFVCGLLSKESAAMLPLLLLSYIFLIEKGKKKYSIVLPYFLIIAVYMVIRQFLGITETFPWRSAEEFALGFLTFLRACLTYLRLIVWPVDLHFDRAREMFITFSDFRLWATVCAYSAIGFTLIRSRKQLTRSSIFFITWICIELFPVSQIITTIGVRSGYLSIAEHFLYMPAIGIFVLLVLSIQKLYRFNQKKRYCSVNFTRLVLAGCILFFMLITIQQSLHAKSALTMFARTLRYNPNNTRIL